VGDGPLELVAGFEGLSVLAIGERAFAGNAVYSRPINGPLHALTAVDLACRVALTSSGVVMLTLPTDIQRKSMSEDKPLRLVS
jgi:thiamine pyrophosphate-dependent acetolactate synthase large subunit-like protein